MRKIEKQILSGYVVFLMTLLAIMNYAQCAKRSISDGDNALGEATGAASVLRGYHHRGLVRAQW